MPNHSAKNECPAVAELRRALQGVIPELRGNGIGTIRQDGSRHTAGLAADLMLDSTNSYQKMIADDIIAALIDMQGQIRWHDILYTDWLPGNPPKPFHFHIPGGGGGYGGTRLVKNPNKDVALGLAHQNHIHVDWVDFSLRIPGDTVFVYNWPPDARSTGFAAGLMSRLVLSSRL
ncbi:MAG: hypothetical protein ABSG32_03915 [Terriglobia bacterium]|jgi:hypothetical protein